MVNKLVKSVEVTTLRAWRTQRAVPSVVLQPSSPGQEPPGVRSIS